MNDTTKTADEIKQFCACVFDSSDIVEVRLLPAKYCVWHTPAELLGQLDYFSELNAGGQNIYIGANPRSAVGASDLDGVPLARCLFADFDGVSIEDAKWQIEGAGLPIPTITIFSGHGVHSYWRLKSPIDNLAHWTAIQKQIIQSLNSDASIHDPPRIMRLPGFQNVKTEPAVPCYIVQSDSKRRFHLSTILESLPAIVLPPPQAPVVVPGLAFGGTDALGRASLYVAKVPAVGEGERNRAAFRLAATLSNDFLLGDDDTWRLLTGWNSGCTPPLEAGELLAVLESSKQHAKKEPGSKAAGRLPGYSLTVGGQRIGSVNGNGKAEVKAEVVERLAPINYSDLVCRFPKLQPPVLGGLLRQGETANIVSTSKVGKSWLAYHLGWSVVSGREFLGQFECEPGPVLLLDNELHPATLAFRLQTVAAAMEIKPETYPGTFQVISLRGQLLDLSGIEKLLEQIKPGDYRLIILDAWYRSLPAGVSENDNAQVMGCYNLIDKLTERLQCGWVCVHHSSKGSQGEKRVTDVGAGAGAQSRAADSHIILREHESPDCVVLDAALRSFKPIEPLPLRWQFPLWLPADDLDPGKLKGRLTVTEQRQGSRDNEGITKLAAALAEGPATPAALRRKTGLSHKRCERLLNILEANGSVEVTETTIRGNVTREYRSVNLED